MKLGANRGFSLIELLVVVAIIAALVVLLSFASGSIINRTRNTQCFANLRQISVASAGYSADHNGEYPPNWTGQDVFAGHLITYLKLPATGVGKKEFRRSVFVCPSDRYVADGEEELDYKGTYAVGKSYHLSYGQNANVSEQADYPAGSRRGAVRNAHALVLYMDFEDHYHMSAYVLNDTRMKALSKRHKGRVNCAFADGHLESVNLTDIPMNSIGYSMFWQGRTEK